MQKIKICYFLPLIRTQEISWRRGGFRACARPRGNHSPQTNLAMPKLWREASWISAAAAALLIALFSSRDHASEQRAAMVQPVTVIAKTATAPAPYAVESDGTRPASHTVRELTDDLTRITTRLAAAERSIDDLTNTVMQQNQTNKDASAKTLPAWTNDEGVTSSVAPATASNEVSPAEAGLLLPPSASAPAMADAQAEGATVSPAAYGADIGGAISMKALNARWTEVRSSHEEMFENLRPVAAVKDNPRTNRVELRLVIASFGSRAEAARLCASLATFHISCQPVMLDSQQIALQ
jgi:hypothetical protein